MKRRVREREHHQVQVRQSHTRRHLVMGFGLAVLGVSACDGETPALRPDAGPDTGQTVGEPTYYEHIRPILVESCSSCHVAGGIAPFALGTYEQAVEVAQRMKEVTRDRIMPPFLADNSGECNTWDNYRGLTDEEIALIGRWVDQGTPMGDPSIEAPDPVVLPGLDSVDLVLEMPNTYGINEGEADDYRCFLVDPDRDSSFFVTGYDVHPGNAQRVHHVIVYNPTDDNEVVRARELDAGDGDSEDGYPCFGGPIVQAVPMVLWAPGGGATRFPRGTGVEVEDGRTQIIQVHYNNLVPDSPNTDRTTIELSTTDSASPAYIAPIADFSLNLQPRSEEEIESYTQRLDFLPFSVRIWGAFPHMHTLGRQLTVDILHADGSEECLIDVPRWDFNWQSAFWLSEPMTITPEDMGRITCVYDTMERDEVVRWGDGTLDEMCLNFVYVTL